MYFNTFEKYSPEFISRWTRPEYDSNYISPKQLEDYMTKRMLSVYKAIHSGIMLVNEISIVTNLDPSPINVYISTMKVTGLIRSIPIPKTNAHALELVPEREIELSSDIYNREIFCDIINTLIDNPGGLNVPHLLQDMESDISLSSLRRLLWALWFHGAVERNRDHMYKVLSNRLNTDALSNKQIVFKRI